MNGTANNHPIEIALCKFHQPLAATEGMALPIFFLNLNSEFDQLEIIYIAESYYITDISNYNKLYNMTHIIPYLKNLKLCSIYKVKMVIYTFFMVSIHF